MTGSILNIRKTSQLMALIKSPKLEFIMEAHNGLSAKIVEEAGFKGIWASGLSISASLGVRDNNEASWTQVLDVLEFMCDATNIPILLDGDTGYGNFNNMRRLVTKLEQRGVAGVCIEDKLFPKTNSFISGEAQPLADVEEFCGKIRAAKDTQKDIDFVVVARVEAFIAGWGLKEALRRAEAYRIAGADAVLIHSKRSDACEIESFMKEWGNRLPVVIVPTKYYSTPTEKFKENGVSLIIWANHNLRTAVKSMQKVSEKIFREESLLGVEDKIVTVSEIFRLQGDAELEEAEKKYLPSTGKKVNAIILAASQGSLGKLTEETPKTLLRVNDKSILETQVDQYNHVGIRDITVVRGFGKEKINFSNLHTVDNDIFYKTKELYSLFLAKNRIEENTVISYGDIVFRKFILNDLLNDSNDITIIVDADFEIEEGVEKDFVITTRPYDKKRYDEPVGLKKISVDLKTGEIHGEFIGLWKVSGKGKQIVMQALECLSKEQDFWKMTTSDLFNEILKSIPIAVKYISGSWMDIDSLVDLHKAEGLK